MLERVADIWTEEADAICITTNGTKNRGRLVMGAGVAKQAADRFDRFPRHAGLLVELHGNHVFMIDSAELHPLWPQTSITEYRFFTFPVKRHWSEKADLKLIERSAHELMKEIDRYDYKTVLLPRPGCGNGQLKWKNVKPVLAPILDDRVVVVDVKQTKNFPAIL